MPSTVCINFLHFSSSSPIPPSLPPSPSLSPYYLPSLPFLSSLSLYLQSVSEETGCHIHFPDSNRAGNMREKSNQVSINGSIENVEVTRVKIRSLLPVTVLCDIPLQVTGQVVRTDVRVCVCVCALCMCVAWRQTAGCHTQHPMQSESPTDRQIIMHSHMPQNVRAYTHTHTHTHYSTYVVFLFPFSVSRPSLTPRPQPSTSSYRPTVSASLLNM